MMNPKIPQMPGIPQMPNIQIGNPIGYRMPQMGGNMNIGGSADYFSRGQAMLANAGQTMGQMDKARNETRTTIEEAPPMGGMDYLDAGVGYGLAGMRAYDMYRGWGGGAKAGAEKAAGTGGEQGFFRAAVNKISSLFKGGSASSTVAGAGSTNAAGFGMGSPMGGAFGEAGGAGYQAAAGQAGAGATGTTGGTAALGGIGVMPVVGAAIQGQIMATDSNPRRINGQPVGDARHGHFLTEPWLDSLGARMGWGPTPGAAYHAGDRKSLMPAIDYWVDPARGGIRYAAENTLGKTAANIIDPVGWSVSLVGKLFG